MRTEAGIKTKKITKSISALILNHEFILSHPISVIQFLQKFKVACNSNILVKAWPYINCSTS